MPFTYHPPTRSVCPICEKLQQHDSTPLIDSHNGKASSASNFPFHNWYHFVLGYSPEFPEFMLKREQIGPDDVVVDPFMGSGTTLITCKQRGIPAHGVDANDFMVDAAQVKLNWQIDVRQFRADVDALLHAVEQAMAQYDWHEQTAELEPALKQLSLFAPNVQRDYAPLVVNRRPEMLVEKYISDVTLAKVNLIDDIIAQQYADSPSRSLFDLALTAIIVPASNIRYGPGFGVGKPRTNVDVSGLFASKLQRMVDDLSSVTVEQGSTLSHVQLGDARDLSAYIAPDSASLMITSPPYPGDHEYTKHTRLELIFRQYANDHKQFRTIKQRMLRASTTNIYKTDDERRHVQDIAAIAHVTNLIERRLEADGATSGFEKLYTKLVWEYFGGMHQCLQACYDVLRPGGKIALLVSDSHAFKMVHIQTADILKQIGLQLGYVNPEILLWQLKTTTSHKYSLRENVLILQKPR